MNKTVGLRRLLYALRRPFKCSSILVSLTACVIVLQSLIIITTMNSQKYWPMYTIVSKAYNDTSMGCGVYGGRTHTNVFDMESCRCGLHFRVDVSQAQVFPTPYGDDKKYLTIGIPTIKRKDENYIVKTLTSLLNNMEDEQWSEIVIVVMVADFDPESRNETIHILKDNFNDAIREGRIHVVVPPQELYSNFKVTKRTYGQEQPYVEWRSKQNFDYAYLMRYSAPLSLYYMQLEDDVIAADAYVTRLLRYIDAQTDAWTCLEFSELGFIGKLYHSADIMRLSQLLVMFFQEQPVDYTYLYFNMLMTQLQKRLSTPTLFQHQGLHSSFPGKVQPLKDRYFDIAVKKYKGDNPSAEVYTTMNTYLNFIPRLAYSSAEGYFWSHGSPVAGDNFIIVFDQPHYVDRVVVDTGSESHPTDILEHAILVASLTIVRLGDRMDCTNDIHLGELKDGRIDVVGVKDKVKFKVVCLQVKVTANQTPWSIIREVAVFLSDNS